MNDARVRMYIESFLLTTEPPQIQGGSVIVGEIQDGAFTVEGFPGDIEFGAMLEIALDDDDAAGPHQVEVVVEYSQLPGAPQAPIGEPFEVDAVEPDDDWWGPRVSVQVLSMSLRFWDEFEGYLVIKVDGEEIAEKALRVFHNYVPDGIGPGEPT